MIKHLIHPFYFVTLSLIFALGCGAVKETDALHPNNNEIEVAPTPGFVTQADINETANAGYQASHTRVNDLLHTALDVRLDWQKRHLLGEATLTLKPFYHPVDSLMLDAKGFVLHRVAAVLANGEKKDLDYEYDGMKLLVFLDRTYKRNETYTVWIKYTAKPDELAEREARITKQTRGLFFMDPDSLNDTVPTHLWTQGETESSSCWFPTIDAPNERQSQEIAVTVNEKFKTLSNGRLVQSKSNGDGTRTDVWLQEMEHPPYLAALIVGDYAIVKDEHPNIDISYYVEPEYEAYAREMFKNTPEILDFFAQIYDFPYPWDKYAQITVHDFIASAMENTGAVVFTDKIQMTHEEMQRKNYEDVVAHEIAHHWFGNLLTCEAWSNIALNESFATYSEYLWFEHRYGRMFADHHLNNDLNRYLAETITDGYNTVLRNYEPDPEAVFDRHTYEKGGRVLHMLRHLLGDDMFFEGIRLYVKANAFKSVEIDELRLAFEAVSGRDLRMFFEQWFAKPGHPKFNIAYLPYDLENKRASMIVQQMQIVDGLPLFACNAKVDVYMPDGSKTRHNLTLDRYEQTFYFDAPQDPALINFDAEKMLLCEKTDQKTVDNLIFQYRHAPLFLDKHEALNELTRSREEHAAEICLEAMRDTFWVFREMAVRQTDLSKKETAEKAKAVFKELLKTEAKPSVRDALMQRLSELKDETYLFELERNTYAALTPKEQFNQWQMIYNINKDKALQVVSALQKNGKLHDPIKNYLGKLSVGMP